MNTQYPFIITATVLVTSAFAINITIVPFQTTAAAPKRCVSTQFSNGDTLLACGPFSHEVAKNAKEDCRNRQDIGAVDKCSSSQTGFGERDNTKPDKE